jgi:alpha-amylase/alpha-mannosidase (GH57 family)
MERNLNKMELNIEFLPVATIALMFYTQTLQNIILLMFSRRRKYDDLELHTNMQEKAFHVSLYWHVLVSCVVFFSLMIT